MKKTDTLSRWPDYDQEKKDNNKQILLKIKALEILKIKRGDIWWRELEDMEGDIEKEVKGIVENREKEWKEKRRESFGENEHMCQILLLFKSR